MNSTDDSYSMTSSLSSSLDQTPLSSLSAASSYASLVNCEENLSIHHDDEQSVRSLHQQKQQQQMPSTQVFLEKKPRKNSTKIENKTLLSSEHHNSTNKINNGSTSYKRSSYSTLQNRHVNKLCTLIEKPVEIHGQGSFPTLNIVPKDFLIELRRAFHVNQIDIKDVRLNGGKEK